ncbi:MAG: RDD family protein [Candidatus Eisenbacteria bacterium]
MTASGSPGRSKLGIRLLAAVLDSLLGLIVALLLAATTGRWFAGRSVVMLSIGSPDTFWRGPMPMLLGILGPLVYGLPFALLLVLLPEALLGAGPGKWALRLRVADESGAPARARSLRLRWAVKCVGLWGMALALVLGKSPAAFAALAATAVVLAGFIAAAGPRRLALHDRLSGTAVFPAGCMGA